jgi:hypothetical protein
MVLVALARWHVRCQDAGPDTQLECAAVPRDNKPNRLQPLVPPARVVDPLAAQRQGLEMMTAANRLAFGWLDAAVAQHGIVTRLALGRMTETARRLAAVQAPADQARAMMDMLDAARTDGLRTAEELAALATRMQDETLGLLERMLKPES